jgi:hypothetical protein
MPLIGVVILIRKFFAWQILEQSVAVPVLADARLLVRTEE